MSRERTQLRDLIRAGRVAAPKHRFAPGKEPFKTNLYGAPKRNNDATEMTAPDHIPFYRHIEHRRPVHDPLWQFFKRQQKALMEKQRELLEAGTALGQEITAGEPVVVA